MAALGFCSAIVEVVVPSPSGVSPGKLTLCWGSQSQHVQCCFLPVQATLVKGEQNLQSLIRPSVQFWEVLSVEYFS